MLVHMGWLGPMPDSAARLVEVTKSVIGAGFRFHAGESDVPDRWRSSLPVRMRSDIQRHAILRKYGGLWLDVDVRIVVHPDRWTAGWDKYTAVRLLDHAPPVGTDIIYCPLGWSGWDLIDDFITAFVARGEKRIPILALASDMILACQSKRPSDFSILQPGNTFPYAHGQFCTESVVARGYEPLPDAPPLTQKIANFAKSAVRHVASGMPMCTQEQVDERFAICQGCEFLKDGACLKCGCPLVREKKFLSKLSWANESCPVGKWGPVGHSSVGPDASAC